MQPTTTKIFFIPTFKFKTMTQYSRFTLIAILSILLFSACNNNTSKSTTVEDAVEDRSNLKKAPQFEVTTIDGEKISLQQSMEENKATVVYFTASWCPMCAKNWPALSEVYPEYEDRINLVSISIDPTDDEDVMRDLDEKHDFKFPVVAGSPQVMLDFGVDSQATTVGITKDGYVAFQKNKSVLTADEYRELFDQLLK